MQMHKQYALGEFELEPDSRRLSRNGEKIHLTKKPFSVLLYLIENRERMVSRQELLENFWDGADVYDETLTKCVGAIRKSFGENTDQPRFIETHWAGGYRFIGEVEERFQQDFATFEIEKIRAVKVTIDEDDAAEPAVQDKIAELHQSAPRSIFSKRLIALPLTVIFLLLAVAGWYFYRSKSAETFAAPIRSLAILPLKNLTGDEGNDYLSDGVTESLIASLSKIKDLTVIARNSSFTYKNKQIDIDEVGNKLNVEAVLTGSVQKEGELLRVNVRLVKVADGRILWAKEIIKPSKEIFALQDEIAGNVLVKIKPAAVDQAELNFERHYTNNPEVYQLYLKGRYFWGRRTKETTNKGLQLFEQAIALDPNYAPAYVGLADTLIVQSITNQISSTEGFPKAREAVKKALEIDDQYGEAHRSLARIKMDFDWDWQGAEIEFKRAIELNPNYAPAHHWYAKFLAQSNRIDEAIREFKRAEELDPLSLNVLLDSALPYVAARQFEKALTVLQEALEMDPNRPRTMLWIAECNVHLGRTKEALAAFQRSQQLDDTIEALGGTAYTFAIADQKDEAKKTLDELLEKSKLRDTSYYEIAGVYAGSKNNEKAFEWLEKAYQSRSASLTYLGIDPRFDNLRSDPRLKDIMKRVGIQTN